MELFFKYMPEGNPFYGEETVTEIPVRSIAEELIREQMLKYIKDEIPHGTAVMIEKFSERRSGLYDIEADIICERDSHKGIIIGRGGAMLKKIGTDARKEIEDLMDARVNLRLFVKVRKNWRDDETFIKSFGYDLKKYR